MNYRKSDDMPKKTLEQLQETHSEMLATAVDIGLEVPAELQLDFTDVKAGETITKNIDALIREHRAAASQPKREDPASTEKKPVAEDDEGEQTEDVTKPTKKSPAKKSKPKKSAPKPKAAKEAVATEENTKVAKATKKAKAKTASKKAASANARTRAKFSDDQKIVKVGDNPCREGSGKFKRVDNVLKYVGKTVKTYMTNGKGKGGTLSWCVKNKVVKVA